MEVLDLGTSTRLHSWSHSYSIHNVCTIKKHGFKKLEFQKNIFKGKRISYSIQSSSLRPLHCTAHQELYQTDETDRYDRRDDEKSILKKVANEVAPVLKGRNIFLVGMMGSGKTTVGKILSEALCYDFYDSDNVVEEDEGGSIAEIFRGRSEEDFRDSESRALKKLSSMCRLVVATGGGAVIRPQNWSYLKKGVTVMLNVPLEALAERVVAVGIHSRPLLGQASGNPYAEALARLTKIYEERAESYENSDIKLSLEDVAAERGYKDVSLLTPSIIATEVLKKMANLEYLLLQEHRPIKKVDALYFKT